MIYIDTREKVQLYLDILAGMPKFLNIFSTKTLPLGDFLVDRPDGRSIIIERKTIPDFCNSVWDKSSGNGTLKSKLMRMINSADEHAILIEGTYTCGEDGNLYFPSARGMMTTIPNSVFFNFLDDRQSEGCKLIYSNNTTETFMHLISMHEKKNPTPNLKIKDWRMFGVVLPGIGDLKWKEITKKYKTPKDAFNNIENWGIRGLNLDRW